MLLVRVMLDSTSSFAFIQSLVLVSYLKEPVELYPKEPVELSPLISFFVLFVTAISPVFFLL